MQQPLLNPRPRAPNRLKSSTGPGGSSSGAGPKGVSGDAPSAPKASQLASPSSRTPSSLLSPFIASKTDDDASSGDEGGDGVRRQLKHKLSNPTMAASRPPDSPPVTIYDHVHDSRSSFASSSTTPAVVKTSSDAIPFPGATGGIPDSPLSAIHPKTRNLAAVTPSRTLSTARRAVLEYPGLANTLKSIQAARAAEGEPTEPPPLTQDWLKTQSREELEALLSEADRAIRERTRDLELAASVGKSLLDENVALRRRQESLVARTASPYRSSSRATSNAELRDRPPPSPAYARKSNANSPFVVGRMRAQSDAFDDTSPPSASGSGANTQPSPTSSRISHRSRLSSTSSISSLFAPPPKSGISGHLATPSEMQELEDANYQLTLQLTELEADSERAEREGKKKLRKLEKELLALREELEHAEQRPSKSPAGTAKKASAFGGRDPSESEGWEDDDDGTPTGRAKTYDALAGLESPKDPEPGHDSPIASPTLGHTSLPVSESSSRAVTPTPSKRARAGKGFNSNGGGERLVIPSREGSLGSSSSSLSTPSRTRSRQSTAADDDSAQEALVAQLMDKIAEMQEINEQLAEQKNELDEKFHEAKRVQMELERRCEELEEANKMIEWEERKAIGWTGHGSGSQVARGNRREIMHATSRDSFFPTSASSSSIASVSSMDSPTQSKSRGSTLTRGNLRSRSLANELFDAGDDTASLFDEPLTPRADNQVVQRSLMDQFGTYEELERAADETAVHWDDEDPHKASPPSPAKPFLKNVKWEHDDAELSMDHDYLSDGSPTRLITDKGKTVPRRRRIAASSNFGSGSSSSSPTKRSQALRKMGFKTPPSVTSEDDEYEDEDDERTYDHLQRRDYNTSRRRKNYYYPLSLTARYHPKTIVARVSDKGKSYYDIVLAWAHLFWLVLFAVGYAVMQGPKKTLGIVNASPRRRLK